MKTAEMIVVDDRSEAERETYRFLVVGTDRCLSNWGGAEGGLSVAAWATNDIEHWQIILDWVRARVDMRRVRMVVDQPGRRYRPRGNVAHFHIYTVHADHPALEATR